MNVDEQDYREQVYAIVNVIPVGRVMTYGQSPTFWRGTRREQSVSNDALRRQMCVAGVINSQGSVRREK